MAGSRQVYGHMTFIGLQKRSGFTSIEDPLGKRVVPLRTLETSIRRRNLPGRITAK